MTADEAGDADVTTPVAGPRPTGLQPVRWEMASA
jgi:hypothetical protein